MIQNQKHFPETEFFTGKSPFPANYKTYLRKKHLTYLKAFETSEHQRL
jgi:hypothetical protein